MKSREIPQGPGVDQKLENLAQEAAQAEKESGSEFMKPEPPKSKRGRPRNEDRPKDQGQKEKPQENMQALVASYVPLSMGLVESLSGFCVRIAEDQRAAIVPPRRDIMVQSGALCGYYFIGPDQEKWVALGTFLLMGAMAFSEAYVLRQENLFKLKQEKVRRDQSNGVHPINPDPVQ